MRIIVVKTKDNETYVSGSGDVQEGEDERPPEELGKN